jgi:hypothetical protein
MDRHFRTGKLFQNGLQGAGGQVIGNQPGRQLAKAAAAQNRLNHRIAIAELVAHADFLSARSA